MPVKSKSQFRMMAAAAHGASNRINISPAKAQEFIDSTPSYKDLPERKAKKKPNVWQRAFGRMKR